MHAYPLNRRMMTATMVFLTAPLPLAVHAQTAPDAGQIIQETSPDENYQPRSPVLDLEFQGEPLGESDAGGTQVSVDSIAFKGNTVYEDSELLDQLGHRKGDDYDLSGLEAIANQISQYYRDNGYPFARAFLPRQDLSKGTLEILVVEGKFGKVTTSGDDAELAEATLPFLSSLQEGDLIKGEKLERAALLMADLPGLSVTPVMRPGNAAGTGDLNVDVAAGRRQSAYVGVDNHGSRSSGRGRVIAGAQANRLLRVGDQLDLSVLYSEEDLWLGRLAYSLPIGYQGWRGEASYARTEYDLRSPFDDFTGTADTASLSFSYPLIRQQQTNLTASIGGEYSELTDRFQGFSYQERSGHSMPLALQFDHRDALGNGGVTFGEARLEPGNVDHNANENVDGSYVKVNLQVSRVQNLSHGFSLLARGDVQWANSELDSSQGKSLGGPGSIRAYPVGEVSGSRAWFTQAEVRYQAPFGITPYVFYDHGARQEFEDEASETLAGGGIGARYARHNWSVDTALATQTTGEAASQDEQKNPRVWFSARYTF